MVPKRATRRAKATAAPPAATGTRRSERVQKPAAKSATKAASKATGRAPGRRASKAAPKASRKSTRKAAAQAVNDASDDDNGSEVAATQPAAPTLPTLPAAPTERATQVELDEDEFGTADNPALADDVEVDRQIQFQRGGTPEDVVLTLRLRIFRDTQFPRLGYYAKIILRRSARPGAVADNNADAGAPGLDGNTLNINGNGANPANNPTPENDAPALNDEEAVGYIHAWRIDKPTSRNHATSRSTWIEKLLTPNLNQIDDAGHETALCLRALFTQKGQAKKVLGDRGSLLDDNSLLFIQMVHIYGAYQRKGLLRHILSAFYEALGRLPEWFVFAGPIVLVPGAPAEGTQRGAAWVGVDVEQAEQVLMNAYATHGGYVVWVRNAKVSTNLITVMGRTVPEGALEQSIGAS